MRIPSKRRHAPVRHENAEEHQNNRDRRPKPRTPRVIEADIANAVETMVQRNKQERDVDRDEPRIVEESLLDNRERQPRRRPHLGREMFDPEVHDEEQQQRRSCDPLQVPIDGSSRHKSIPKIKPRRHNGHNVQSTNSFQDCIRCARRAVVDSLFAPSRLCVRSSLVLLVKSASGYRK
jgi:hypothetical protein